VKYSRKIQIFILVSILALLTVTSIDLILLYQFSDITVVKAFFSFLVPYIISSIFKELKKQDLLPKIPKIKIFPKIKKRNPPKPKDE